MVFWQRLNLWLIKIWLVSSVMKGQKFHSKVDLVKDYQVSKEFKDKVEPLIVRNSGLFASKDNELGNIDSENADQI